MKRITWAGFIKQDNLTCTEPYFLDLKMFDIPKTIELALNNMPNRELCKAISFDLAMGAKNKLEVEKICKELHIHPIWSKLQLNGIRKSLAAEDVTI